MFIDQPSVWNASTLLGGEAGTDQSVIRILDDIPAGDWDLLVTQFDDASQDASCAFRAAVWGENRISRIAVAQGGSVIGLALAVTVLVPGLSRGVAHLRAGPLWRRKGEPVNPANLVTVLTAVAGYFVRQKKLCLKVLPPADPRYMEDYVKALTAAGFSRREIHDDNRYLVNAAIGAEQQMASLGQKWRYNLKKALKTELAIGVESGPAALETFDTLFREMESRKTYQGDTWHPVCAAMRQGFPEAVHPSIVVARLSGQPIAAAVIGHIGDTAHYIYGATADAATPLNAGYAMHWWIINWLHGQGHRWYDLGGESGDQGLRQFKKGFAGRDGAVVALAGEFTLCRDPLSRLANQAFDLARAAKVAIKRSPVKRRVAALLRRGGQKDDVAEKNK